MSDTMWFTKEPGKEAANEEALFVGVPDRVRLPMNLGGKELKVLRCFLAPCPKTKIVCRHLELEDGFFVAESDQFYWYRKGNQ